MYDNKLNALVNEPVQEKRIITGCEILTDLFCQCDDLTENKQIKDFKNTIFNSFIKTIANPDHTAFFTNTKMKCLIYKLIFEESNLTRNAILNLEEEEARRNINYDLIDKLYKTGAIF